MLHNAKHRHFVLPAVIFGLSGYDRLSRISLQNEDFLDSAVCQWPLSQNINAWKTGYGFYPRVAGVAPLSDSDHTTMELFYQSVKEAGESKLVQNNVSFRLHSVCSALEAIPHTVEALSAIILSDVLHSKDLWWKARILDVRHQFGAWAASHFDADELYKAELLAHERFRLLKEAQGTPLNSKIMLVGLNFWHGFTWQYALDHLQRSNWDLDSFWDAQLCPSHEHNTSCPGLHGTGHAALYAALSVSRGIRVLPCMMFVDHSVEVTRGEMQMAEDICAKAPFFNMYKYCFDGLYHAYLHMLPELGGASMASYERTPGICERARLSVACFARIFYALPRAREAGRISISCNTIRYPESRRGCVLAASFAFFVGFDKVHRMSISNSANLKACTHPRSGGLEAFRYLYPNTSLSSLIQDSNINLPPMRSWCDRYAGDDLQTACIIGAASTIRFYLPSEMLSRNALRICEHLLGPAKHKISPVHVPSYHKLFNLAKLVGKDPVEQCHFVLAQGGMVYAASQVCQPFLCNMAHHE